MKRFLNIGAIVALILGVASIVNSAQVDRSVDGVVGFSRLRVTNIGQVVGTPGATLLTLNTGSLIGRVFVQCAIQTPGSAFNTFVIRAAVLNSTQVATLASITADYTTGLRAPMVSASSNLTTLVPGAFGWFLLDTIGIDQIIVSATTSPAASTVSCYASGGGI